MKVEDIQTKYYESHQFLQARKKRQSQQLQLLSNLRRGDLNISSTLMLTLFDRVMSSIYDDRMQVKFVPSQGITQEQINDFNTLAQSDYQEMGKAKLDYDWSWDSLFFGRGYTETLRFDKKRKILQPHVINPLAMGYDPYFENPQEWRYYWKFLTKGKHELNALIKKGILKVKSIDEIPTGVDQYYWDYKIRRDQARDGVAPPIQPADNDVFQILEFFGYDDEGKKCVYWTDKNFSQILYEYELDLDDGDEIVGPDGSSIDKQSNWPIIVKESFRVPHSSLPISVADLLEDKHRAKSVLLNLAYVAAKDQANPLYWYNDNIQDQSQFLSRQVNQHIKLDGTAVGDNSVGPINKAVPMSPELIQFISVLQQEANEPIGTGQRLQPSKGRQQTATETSIEQQLNDIAQSLQSKVMQFGENEFWTQWFYRYANNADELKEKTANIVGVKGVDSRIINLKQFKTKFPPGVLTYSTKEAEYKDLVRRRDFMQLYPALAQTLDPEGMRNFQKHVFFPLFVQDSSLIDVMFPKTLDEMRAEEENEMLIKDQLPNVSETDDHTTHIYMHYMVQPKTWSTWLHLDWHQRLLANQKKQAMMAEQMAQSGSMGMSGGQGRPKVSKEKKSPMEAASPLKTEIKSDNLSKAK